MTQENYLKVIEKHLPLLIQPKEDGFRCLINEKQFPRSRTDKPIPNKWIKKCLHDLELPYGFDGELVTVNTEGRNNFNAIQSHVSTELGTPNFYYVVFDWFGSEIYEKRYERIKKYIEDDISNEGFLPYISLIQSHLCTNMTTVHKWYNQYLSLGYEGVCLRSPRSPYKQGRSTLNNGYLFALTPWDTSEAIVVGVEEELEGLNDIGKGTLGSMICRDDKFILDFNVGSGFTHLQRMEFWEQSKSIIGKTIAYKYKANRSHKDRPISPIFKGFRSESEL